MSFVIKVFEAFDNRDIDAIANLTHEDFVQVDDYEMASREDWIEELRVLFASGNTPDFSRDRTVIAYQRDIFSMQFTREVEGVLYRITNVFLKKDGKFWRYQVNRVPI